MFSTSDAVDPIDDSALAIPPPLPSPHSQDLLLMMLNQGLLRLLVCPYAYVAIFSDLYVICWIGLITSSSSSIHKQQAQAWLCRATGICRGPHHIQLSPAVTGMAAQSS